MKFKNSIIALSLAVALAGCSSNTQMDAPVETANVNTLDSFFSESGKTVTNESYPTDETSHQLLKNQDLAGVNTFLHKRQLTPTDSQPVVRMNRDTYYSLAVVDVSKGATITMPDVPEGTYISVQAVTEDHRIQAMHYGSGTFDLKTHTGTHLYIVVRLDSTLTEEQARKYQDQMSISAQSDTLFSAEPVNQASFEKVENNLKSQVIAITKRDGINAMTGMFTAPNDDSQALYTDEKYQVGAAIGWGGAQFKDNVYEVSGNYPSDTCYQANFEDPKNKAFWSITVYDKKGFMFNDLASVNSNTIDANKDGTYTVSFGCGSDAPNNIETKNDSGVFNLGIRHYMPTEKVKTEGYRILPTVKAM